MFLRLKCLDLILLFKKGREYHKHLLKRAEFTAIGSINGHVSEIDKLIATAERFTSLNRFERWLLQPHIDLKKEINQDAFRKTALAITGEDPNEWGKTYEEM